MTLDDYCLELALHSIGDGALLDSQRRPVDLEPHHVEPATNRLSSCIKHVVERELAAIADEIRAERLARRVRA